MTDDEDQFQVQVTFHGGGTINAGSMDEAEEIARNSDWTANGISSITIENLRTGYERELWK